MQPADTTGFDTPDRMRRRIGSRQKRPIELSSKLSRVMDLPSLVIALWQFQVAFANYRLPLPIPDR